jgi:hypothetical protein
MYPGIAYQNCLSDTNIGCLGLLIKTALVKDYGILGFFLNALMLSDLISSLSSTLTSLIHPLTATLTTRFDSNSFKIPKKSIYAGDFYDVHIRELVRIASIQFLF